MTRSLLSLATHLYGTAAVLYLAHLVRQWPPLAWLGRAGVAAGLVAHSVALAGGLALEGMAPRTMPLGLSFLAFLLLSLALALDVSYRKPVLGAFITPAAVAILVPGVLLHNQSAPLGPDVSRSLLPVHITIALAGVAAIAVATFVAVMYVLLERQMKGKRFGLWFSRLPSLQFLDVLNRRLVIGGFIALSLTLVTGAFFVSGPSGIRWTWKEIATLVAWLHFGVLLNARYFAGWQGRRVALLTMAGFGLLLVSFFSSYDLGRGLH